MQQQYCQPITVRLIEPHPLARNYLLSLLGKCPEIEVRRIAILPLRAAKKAARRPSSLLTQVRSKVA